MREIKFRAWNKEEKRMNYDVVIIDGEAIKRGYIATAWLKEAKAGDVIMQYTGIRDKNGVEIYEGDVVKGIFEFTYEVEEGLLEISREEVVGEVVFQMRSFGVLFDGDCFVPLMDAIPLTLEKLGNIFENPELLEQEG